MIGSLRGTVLDRTVRPGAAAEVLVEVGGVGYRVVVPTGGAAALGTPGSAVFLFVHTHVREDAIILYGFPTRDERACFEALIGTHGVGPAVAMALLSVHSPAALQRAVQTEDVDALTLVPGIGPKTAKRLVVELKSRLDIDFDGPDGSEPQLRVVQGSDGADGAGPGRANGKGRAAAHDRAAVRADVRVALSALGYGADEIRQAMSGLPADGSVEEHVRLALRELAAAR